MKITNIRAVQPDSPDAPDDWRTIVGQILVAVDTDSGLTGYGVGGGGAAAIHVITRLLRDLLLDKDPSNINVLWDEMYRATVPYGRKGLTLMAISGVDLALWDLRGKAENTPVCRLLASAPHEAVPCYASLGTDPSEAVEQGYQVFKLHLPGAANETERGKVLESVAVAREIIGPDRRLMTDAFMRWDVPTTLSFAQEFQKLNVEWIEEPLLPDDFAGYAELVSQCPIPISGGEHEFTAAGFEFLAKRKLHAILQPDVTWCGGLTQMIEIYSIARRHGLTVCQHRGAEIWGLHAIAALEPEHPLAEQGRSWMTWVEGQPPIEQGIIKVPTAPGFGAIIDESDLP